MFNRIITFAVTFILVALFYRVGYVNGTNDMADTVKPPQISEYDGDRFNTEVLRSYMEGTLSEEDADKLYFPTQVKTVTIPLNIGKWGSTEIGEYDPAQDPHAGKNSPYGIGSCVITSADGSFGCGDDPKSHFKCTIYVKIEKGPMAGTTFYSKSCDGKPIA
jgi:hypothetical protein